MQSGGLNLPAFPATVRLSRRTVLTGWLLMSMARAAQAQTTPEEELKIGLDPDYPPYTYYDDQHQLTGLDPALAREACGRIGVNPVFVPIAWDKKNEWLAKGAIDCIWSCFSIDGREDHYLWVPYLYSRQVVVVPQSSDIQRVADLKERPVAVQASTKPENYFMQDPKAPRLEELISLPTTAEAFTALKNSYVEAVAGHEAVLLQLIHEVPGAYRMLDEPLQTVKVGVAFPLSFKRLDLINRLKNALNRMAAEGEVARLASAFGLEGEKVAMMPAD